MRSDSSFEQFYSSTVQEAEVHCGEPCLPRYRRLPKWIDEGSAPHSFESPQDYYGSHYYYALDLIIEEICDRFERTSMLLPKEMENMLMTAANNVDTSKVAVPETVQSTYLQDIDARKLELQLQMLPDLVKGFKKSKNLT